MIKRVAVNVVVGLVCLSLGLFTGCGKSKLPFQYRYVSANGVEITYQGRVYSLERYGPKIQAPFDYEFESDGDLDITINGRTYDIDSPYDLDKPKIKKKKTTSKTKKKRSKRK